MGLAAFAASAIAGSDPIRTGFQSFFYDIRTAILPFMFIFNHELLLINIHSWWHLLLTITTAIVAMLVFAAATQGFFLVKNRLWETLVLLLVTFSLFRPGFWWDHVYPPMETVASNSIVEFASKQPSGAELLINVQGENTDGKFVKKLVSLPLGEPGLGEERISRAGISLRIEENQVFIDNVVFNSKAEKMGIDLDWEIVSLAVPLERPPKQLIYIPAFFLLILIIVLQRFRQREHSS